MLSWGASLWITWSQLNFCVFCLFFVTFCQYVFGGYSKVWVPLMSFPLSLVPFCLTLHKTSTAVLRLLDIILAPVSQLKVLLDSLSPITIAHTHSTVDMKQRDLCHQTPVTYGYYYTSQSILKVKSTWSIQINILNILHKQWLTGLQHFVFPFSKYRMNLILAWGCR